MKAIYFAWVRERIGKDERGDRAAALRRTVADLIAWLSSAARAMLAFENPELIRAALDQTHVKHDAPIGNAREVAFFPPMTGG